MSALRKLKVEPHWRKIPCPFCGLAVYFDDKLLRVHHQAPCCKKYLQAVEQHGGQYIGDAEIKP